MSKRASSSECSSSRKLRKTNEFERMLCNEISVPTVAPVLLNFFQNTDSVEELYGIMSDLVEACCRLVTDKQRPAIDVLCCLQDEMCCTDNGNSSFRFKDLLSVQVMKIQLSHLDDMRSFLRRLRFISEAVRKKLVGIAALFFLAENVMKFNAKKCAVYLYEVVRKIDKMVNGGYIHLDKSGEESMETLCCSLWNALQSCDKRQREIRDMIHYSDARLHRACHRHNGWCRFLRTEKLSCLSSAEFEVLVDALMAAKTEESDLHDVVMELFPSCQPWTSNTAENEQLFRSFLHRISDFIAVSSWQWRLQLGTFEFFEKISRWLQYDFGKINLGLEIIAYEWTYRSFHFPDPLTYQNVDEILSKFWFFYEMSRRKWVRLSAPFNAFKSSISVSRYSPTSKKLHISLYFHYRVFRSLSESSGIREIFLANPQSANDLRGKFNHFYFNIQKVDFAKKDEIMKYITSIENNWPWRNDDNASSDVKISSCHEPIVLSTVDSIVSTTEVKEEVEIIEPNIISTPNILAPVEEPSSSQKPTEETIQSTPKRTEVISLDDGNEIESLKEIISRLDQSRCSSVVSEISDRIFKDILSEGVSRKVVKFCADIGKVRTPEGKRFMSKLQSYWLEILGAQSQENMEETLECLSGMIRDSKCDDERNEFYQQYSSAKSVIRKKFKDCPKLIGKLFLENALPLSFVISYLEKLVEVHEANAFHGLRNLLKIAGKDIETQAEINGLGYKIVNMFAELYHIRMTTNNAEMKEIIEGVITLKKNNWSAVDDKKAAVCRLNDLLSAMNSNTARDPQKLLVAKEAVMDFLESLPNSFSTAFYEALLNKIQQNALDSVKREANSGPPYETPESSFVKQECSCNCDVIILS